MAANSSFKSFLGLVCAIVFMALISEAANAMSANADQLILKDVTEEPRGAKLVGSPNSLVRFLFYNARPSDHPSGSLLGYKRSSSALDALTGVTLGKRSGPSEYLNLDPFYGRQYGLRSVPRMYDVRWAPLDTYDAPIAAEIN